MFAFLNVVAIPCCCRQSYQSIPQFQRYIIRDIDYFCTPMLSVVLDFDQPGSIGFNGNDIYRLCSYL